MGMIERKNVCVCVRESREREREREEKKHLFKDGLKYGETQDPFTSKAFCQQVALNFDPREKKNFIPVLG
jgi:hypothetical protein